jgi:photosystem II stability/assembly factor-like uncharacterized protein
MGLLRKTLESLTCLSGKENSPVLIVNSKLVTLLATTALIGGSALAGPPKKAPRLGSPPAFAGMKYRLVGPFRGGRATGVAGVPNDVNTYYFGAAAGGVWKTTDAGNTWKPLWDNLPEASPSVGAIVVSPSNPSIIYAGTGEGAIRGNVVAGNGIFKSTDAGKTWSFSGLRDSQYIGRMAISATDPNTVFVAALGHIWGRNEERGIYRTKDGGKTWQRVLFVNDKTGGIDVQIDPTDPNTVYAAMWEVYRKPWTLETGGPGSGLYRSRDGGATWEKISGKGLPGGILGRIGVAPTSDPKRVYALIEAEKGGLYRTDDGGESWKLINGDNAYKWRGWYFDNVFADPKDPDKVFVMNTNAYKSLDGGKSFKTMPTSRGDNHQMWINPIHTNYMVNSNDGGGNVSVNAGETWTDEMNQPTAQFYHVATDGDTPYHLYGAQQDNSTVKIASGNVRGPIGVESFHSVGGGESGYVVPDPKDSDVVFANSWGGKVTRYDHNTRQLISTNPWEREVTGWAPKDRAHRAQWTAPLAFSPHDPNVLYNGNEVLFKSIDAGKSWSIISPDLTRNDKSKQIAPGGPIIKEVTDVETYGTIFSINESPVEKGLIWAGTDDGLVQVTRDGGANWANVTPKDMPEWETVDMVEPHPHKPGTAYIAVDGHRMDDLRPHAFKTSNYGKTWTSITEGLPKDAYVHVVRADPEREGLLYAGTENGIFVSFNDGGTWKPLQMNLPRTPIPDLVVHARDLAVATTGRSFYVLDDLSPLHQWNEAIESEQIHLFAPRAALRVQYAAGSGDNTSKFTGTNPPQGAIVYYNLRDGIAEKGNHNKRTEKEEQRERARRGTHEPSRAKFEILDASGKVIRTYETAPGEENQSDEGSASQKSSQFPTKQGLNRFVWDLRYEGPVKVPKQALWDASSGGPVALPGHYQARLTVGGTSQVQPFDVLPNPSLNVTQDQLKKQFDLITSVNEHLNEVQNAVLEIRGLHRQLAGIRASAGPKPKGAQIIAAADTLEANMYTVESKLTQIRSISRLDPLNIPIGFNTMLASLATSIGLGDTEPTRPQYEEFRILSGQAEIYLAEWNQVKVTAVPQFNAVVAQGRQKPLAVDALTERQQEELEASDTTEVVALDDD